MSHFEQAEAVKSAEAVEAGAAATAHSRLFEDSYGKPGGGGSTGKSDGSTAEARPAGGSSNGASSDSCIEIKPLKKAN